MWMTTESTSKLKKRKPSLNSSAHNIIMLAKKDVPNNNCLFCTVLVTLRRMEASTLTYTRNQHRETNFCFLTRTTQKNTTYTSRKHLRLEDIRTEILFKSAKKMEKQNNKTYQTELKRHVSGRKGISSKHKILVPFRTNKTLTQKLDHPKSNTTRRGLYMWPSSKGSAHGEI